MSTIAAAGLAAASGAAHAQVASSWRCTDAPGESDCQDALINDIESGTKNAWPAFVTFNEDPIPYTCTQTRGPVDPRVVAATARTITINGSVTWSSTWTGIMQDFVIGGHTASTFLSLSMSPSGSGLSSAFWTGNQMAFLYSESPYEVQSSAGSTGVSDLGAVMTESPSGPVWNASLHIRIDPGDGAWSCAIGPGGPVHASGTGYVTFDYPLAYTSLKARLQEAIRNDFRGAVRRAVGLP